jgi:hypothetical protein
MSGLCITPSGRVGCLTLDEHGRYLDLMLQALDSAKGLASTPVDYLEALRDIGPCATAVVDVVRESGYHHLVDKYTPLFAQRGLDV